MLGLSQFYYIPLFSLNKEDHCFLAISSEFSGSRPIRGSPCQFASFDRSTLTIRGSVHCSLFFWLVKTARQKRRGSMIQLNRFIDLYWMNQYSWKLWRWSVVSAWEIQQKKRRSVIDYILSCRLCCCSVLRFFCRCLVVGGRPWKKTVFFNRSLVLLLMTHTVKI